MLLAGMMGPKATAAAMDVASTAAAADISTPEAATLTMGSRGSECAFGEDKSVHSVSSTDPFYLRSCYWRRNRNVDSDPLTRTPINSMPITAFATFQLIILPIKKAVLPRRLVR